MTDSSDNNQIIRLENDKQADSGFNEKSLFIRKYTEEEITSIYELARLSFETGNLKRAEIICSGLTAIAADFVPSFMLLAIISAFNNNYEKTLELTQSILQRDANNIEAQLLSASVYMNNSNFNMAGTMLGEISEKVKRGVELNPALRRFFDVQLARFESR